MASDNRMRDPYSILGLSRSADQLAIKAAWRQVAKQLHPDHNRNDPNAQSRFTEANRAYDLLKDPVKRKKYDDMIGRSSFSSGANGNSGSSSGSSSSGRAGKEPTFMEQRAERARAEAEARARAEAEARMREEAEAEARAKARAKAEAEAKEKAETQAKAKSEPDAAAKADETPETHEHDPEAEAAFNQLFGERRKSERSSEKPADEQAAPDAEAAKAKTAKADAPKSDAQKPEETSGAQQEYAANAGSSHEASDPQAEGAPSPALNLITYLVKRLTGQVPAPEKAPDMAIDAMVSLEDLMNRINPTVTLTDGKLQTVPLPDGAMDGTTVRLEGYGYKLPGMKRGDVIVTLRIKPHKWYRADFYDLHTYHDIDIENAVLGCEAKVETLDGIVRIKVPEWSGSDRTVKIPGKGLPRGNGQRGDMIVEIRVMLWDRPDQKVVDLMRSLREGLVL